ncbi:hypothetical protein [Thermococcus sp. ES12]|uniref:hypothetical protein n=1 Tax=Thermococcus sp. ES12 TaxID=1638246 RepID=UPI0014315599|nr:hypothetical protein [Thermococcus sp. ES12]NJE77124.1 hypothetical protein [Thermococcus sp. ES12]
MKVSAREVGVWKMGYLTIGLIFMALSIFSWAYGRDFLGFFFSISGLTLLWEADKRRAMVVSVDGRNFKVLVRGRKAPFEVILLENERVSWRGTVEDYVEVGDFSFDIVDGKLSIKFNGKEIGRLG